MVRRARAQSSTWLTLPEGLKGSTGPSCLAGQARSSDAVEEVARQCWRLSHLALAPLSLSCLLSLALSLSLHAHAYMPHARSARAQLHTHTDTRTEWHARWNGMRWNDTDNMHACEMRAHPHALSCTGRGAAAGSAAPVAPFGTSSTASLGCAPDAPFGASFAALHVCSPFFGAHAGAPHAAARARARRRCRRGTHITQPLAAPVRHARWVRAAPTIGATRGASAVAMAVETCLLHACLLACLTTGTHVPIVFKSSQVKSSQVKSSQVKSSQVKVKSSQVKVHVPHDVPICESVPGDILLRGAGTHTGHTDADAQDTRDHTDWPACP